MNMNENLNSSTFDVAYDIQPNTVTWVDELTVKGFKDALQSEKYIPEKYITSKSCDSSYYTTDYPQSALERLIKTKIRLTPDQIQRIEKATSYAEFMISCDVANEDPIAILKKGLFSSQSAKCFEFCKNMLNDNELSFDEFFRMTTKLGNDIEDILNEV